MLHVLHSMITCHSVDEELLQFPTYIIQHTTSVQSLPKTALMPHGVAQECDDRESGNFFSLQPFPLLFLLTY
jgi:hypothetical protein